MKIGINGFGRIGRILSRKILQKENLILNSINHPTMNREDFEYLLKYDSVHGAFNTHGTDKDVIIHNQRQPSDIAWDTDLDFIIDTTGKFKELTDVTEHIHNPNTRLVVSAPSKSLPMYIYGVNHELYKGEQFISAASCTTTCMAPIAKILNDNYKISSGLATTIHSVTGSQHTVDKYKTGTRTGRSILNNIIPSSTGAAKAIGKIIPELDGKLNAIGIRVPVANVSLLDLSVTLEQSVSIEDIMEKFDEESNSKYKGILGVSKGLEVSSDFIGSPLSAIIDAQSCMSIGELHKITAWYDNEYGYASKLLDLVEFISKE